MKTFNEIMKIRDEPDNKPEVTKRKFQVKKTNNEKMQAFGWASVAIAENGETLEDWQGDIIHQLAYPHQVADHLYQPL